MNTRLQVEHPVTEYITNVDLVEEMIKIAAGEKIGYKQQDIPLNGWAFESRVYAENPFQKFLPSIGWLERYIEPYGENIRCDSGIREGSEISIHYDPLICKLVTYGKDRDAALAKMREALDQYVIRGVNNNISFLRALCDHPRFIKGNITTAFIEEEYPDGFHGIELTNDKLISLLSSTILVAQQRLAIKKSITGQLSTVNFDLLENENLFVKINNSHLYIAQLSLKKDNFNDDNDDFLIDDESVTNDIDYLSYNLTFRKLDYEQPEQAIDEIQNINISTNYINGDIVFHTYLDNKTDILQCIDVKDESNEYKFQYEGNEFTCQLLTAKELELSKFMPIAEEIDTSKVILSPMPGGILFKMMVNEGEQVNEGQEICIVEAMKMQNILRASKSGVISKIHAQTGDTVASEQVLVEFED